MSTLFECGGVPPRSTAAQRAAYAAHGAQRNASPARSPAARPRDCRQDQPEGWGKEGQATRGRQLKGSFTRILHI